MSKIKYHKAFEAWRDLSLLSPSACVGSQNTEWTTLFLSITHKVGEFALYVCKRGRLCINKIYNGRSTFVKIEDLQCFCFIPC